jgi:hypothetical protein
LLAIKSPPKKHRKFTLRFGGNRNVQPVMKRAFVLRLNPEASPSNGKMVGRIEEVDTGRTVKFSSIEEFLAFLQQCLDDDATPAE